MFSRASGPSSFSISSSASFFLAFFALPPVSPQAISPTCYMAHEGLLGDFFGGISRLLAENFTLMMSESCSLCKDYLIGASAAWPLVAMRVCCLHSHSNSHTFCVQEREQGRVTVRRRRSRCRQP